jgi:RNA-directed DNA polymerase
MRKRVQAKLGELKLELKRRMHQPIPELGKWLRSVVGGHIRYYGVPSNSRALSSFHLLVGRLWRRALCRRSQNGLVTWTRMKRLIKRWLPNPRICHPYPEKRLCVTT